MMKRLSTNYGHRDNEIKELFEENGLIAKGKGTSFKSVEIADQVSNFAIYTTGTESEKDIVLSIFEKNGASENTIRRNPEPKAPRKCCARWNHSEKDAEIMLRVTREIISALGRA